MSVETTQYVRHHVFVDVLDDYLWVAEDHDGALYLPVRPSCAALELDSTSALETIKADSRLAPGLARVKLPTAGGEQVQQCLRAREYSWWLMLVDPRRFKPERRAKLIARQNALMNLAEEIVLKRKSLGALTKPQQKVSGQVEAHVRCLKCGAPHLLVIDGQGWHMYAAVEVE